MYVVTNRRQQKRFLNLHYSTSYYGQNKDIILINAGIFSFIISPSFPVLVNSARKSAKEVWIIGVNMILTEMSV